MYELYTIINNAAPKIWLYSEHLKMYDENGNIVSSGMYDPEETSNE